MAGTNTFVDDEHIAIEDLGALHGVSFHREEESRDRIANQVLIDVEPLIRIVGGRTRKASRHPNLVNRQWQAWRA